MTLLGILITLAIGVGIGYWLANARGREALDDDRRDRNRNNIARQRSAFAEETGTIGELDDPYKTNVKPAAASALAFLKEDGTNMNRSPQQVQQQAGAAGNQPATSSPQAAADQQTVTSETQQQK
ncbi:hypothetical protein [Effusibacillus consociatus]|uniref:Uncharacterized protein n=1 Tax=Effusibacillus consociatus TaxID=1117041 RepID=A0ABV9PXG3_9BACL